MNQTGYVSASDPQASTGALSGNSSVEEDAGYSVEKLRKQYMDFISAKTAEIEEQRLHRHYFHNDQLSTKELKVLADRHQPAIIENKIKRKINGVVGLVERLRQDPKAYPRTPQEDERGGADLATAAVRFVLDKPNEDDSDWPTTSAEAARNGSINGIFGIDLALVRGDHGDPDLSYALVDPDTFFYDPRSFKYSFSDARFMGVAKWIDLDYAKELFPDQAETLESLGTTGGGNLETWQQIDREFKWIDTNLKRVFIVEHWHIRGGEWYWCFYTGSTKLGSGKSEFIDEKGKMFCRFIMASVNVDHDGDRYGFIRELKPLQDEVNARRSKALHLLNVRRIIMTEGAVADIETTRKEAVRPDGVIVKNPGSDLEFDDQKTTADMQGQLEFLAQSATSIENFGPNPALIGQGIENKSGRAIALLQQAGIAELGPFILAYRGWKLRVYRAIWNMLPRIWTSERWIRVTDDEGVAQFIGLNQVALDQYGIPTMVNAIGALDVDIILDEGPDTINLMQDTYDTLQAMSQAGAQIPPEILIELSPTPAKTKRKLLEIMAKANQPDPQAQQLQLDDANATVQGKRARAAKDMAGARKTMAEVPSESAKATRDKAAALRDVIGAATDLHNARQPPPDANGKDGAKPSDGGLGQFETIGA